MGTHDTANLTWTVYLIDHELCKRKQLYKAQ